MKCCNNQCRQGRDCPARQSDEDPFTWFDFFLSIGCVLAVALAVGAV